MKNVCENNIRKLSLKAIAWMGMVAIVVVLVSCGDSKYEATSSSSTYLEEEASKDAVEADFSFSQLENMTFHFLSGAGAWETWLVINADGTFSGSYHDSDMGDPSYEGGVVYLCDFNGEFDPLIKVDDYTYKTKIKNINYDREPEESEVGLIDETEVGFRYTTAYGLDEAEDIYFYLPGKPVSELSEEFLSWVRYEIEDFETGERATNLTFYGLFNEAKGEGFFSTDGIMEE